VELVDGPGQTWGMPVLVALADGMAQTLPVSAVAPAIEKPRMRRPGVTTGISTGRASGVPA
jgi:hypothetical protein